MESILLCLGAAGLALEPMYSAYHVLDTYVVGSTSQLLGYRNLGDRIGEARDFILGFTGGDYPRVAAHIRQHVDGGHGDDFAFGLDLILDGLARMSQVD